MGWSQRFASLASNADMTVGIIGLGYVGLPTAIGFHDAGFTVWGVDVSQRTVDMVNAGENPTGDPDVDDIVPQPGTERWHITTSRQRLLRNATSSGDRSNTHYKRPQPDLSYEAPERRCLSRYLEVQHHCRAGINGVPRRDGPHMVAAD